MKKRNRVQVIVAALAVFALTGCAAVRPVESQKLPDADQPPHQQPPAVSQSASQTQPSASQPAPQIPSAPQTPSVPEAPASQGQPAEKRLTPEQAKVIALSHAGFTADQVTGLRAEFDVDDGVAHYDVEFRQDRWEYEYEIHSQNGGILSFEKDD